MKVKLTKILVCDFYNHRDIEFKIDKMYDLRLQELSGKKYIGFVDKKYLKCLDGDLLDLGVLGGMFGGGYNMEEVLFYIYYGDGVVVYPDLNIEKIVKYWNGDTDDYRILSMEEYIIKGILE
jgi:hypothetical protein